MRTWEDYKTYAKGIDEQAKRDIEEMETIASIISSMNVYYLLKKMIITKLKKDFSTISIFVKQCLLRDLFVFFVLFRVMPIF